MKKLFSIGWADGGKGLLIAVGTVVLSSLYTLLQAGSLLRDSDGNIIAEYFFRDVELNPEFDEKQFTRDKL